MSDPVYVSITGLRVRRIWHLPRFWHHAVRAMAQAQQADGCLGAAAKTINGVHHTRSVWRNRDAMRGYLRLGAHLRAMQAFPEFAEGKTLGFETADIPDWDQVHALWLTQGREVGSKRTG